MFMCSKCYHSLVQLVMGSESTSDMAAKEQAWNVLEEILGLLDQSKVYTISCSYNRLRVSSVIFFQP